MKQQASWELFTYWNELRGPRAAPDRAEIDPRAIRGLLADTFILEIDEEHLFPFRVAGTRVNAHFTVEQRTRSFLDIWMVRDRRSISALLLTVVDGACPIVAGAAAVGRDGAELEFEFLFLPLRHRGKTHSRILGLMTAASQPSWVGLRPLEPLDLRTLRVVGADQKPTQPPRTAPQPATPRLRVIQGGLATENRALIDEETR
jgi:hypothetical protein